MLPVLTLLLFAAFQASLWNHARAVARATARATAAAVARSGADPVDAERDATSNLANVGDLTGTRVQVTVSNEPTGSTVTVHITGKAPGIIVGTTTSIDVSVAMPVEQWSPL